ncbi:hypothetical protein D3C87_2144600 [compost metagenome]
MAATAIQGRSDEQIKLIDEPGGKEGAVDRGSAFEQQLANAEFLLQYTECCRQVDLGGW